MAEESEDNEDQVAEEMMRMMEEEGAEGDTAERVAPRRTTGKASRRRTRPERTKAVSTKRCSKPCRTKWRLAMRGAMPGILLRIR